MGRKALHLVAMRLVGATLVASGALAIASPSCGTPTSGEASLADSGGDDSMTAEGGDDSMTADGGGFVTGDAGARDSASGSSDGGGGEEGGGACSPCGPGHVCVDGGCACPPYQSLCNGRCIPTSGDPNNCGGCGTTCTGIQVCSSNACS